VGGEEVLERVWRRFTVPGWDGRGGEDCRVRVDEFWHVDVFGGKLGEVPPEIRSFPPPNDSTPMVFHI